MSLAGALHERKGRPRLTEARLDVAQHMSLCRHYVHELRRSVLVSTPDLEKTGSKRSSQVLENFERMSREEGPSGTGNNGYEKRMSDDQRLSAFLRNDGGNPHHSLHTSHGSQPSLGGSPLATKPQPFPAGR